MTERRPNRTLGGVHTEFWDHCAAGRLSLQQCESCAEWQWPPRERCDECAGELAWHQVSGTGKLISWATFHQPYYQELPVPYETILVELTEGSLFISNPRGFTRSEMIPGLPVRVEFLAAEDGHGPFRLPVFTRATP
jgi:uncharacterized protein